MNNGLKNIAHSFVCLLLGWQLFNASVDMSRFVSYVYQLYQQSHSSSDDSPVAEEANLFLELDWEDCAGAENDESEASEEEQEPFDFFYTRPDGFILRHLLQLGKHIPRHSFDANLQSIALETAFPPPER